MNAEVRGFYYPRTSAFIRVLNFMPYAYASNGGQAQTKFRSP